MNCSVFATCRRARQILPRTRRSIVCASPLTTTCTASSSRPLIEDPISARCFTSTPWPNTTDRPVWSEEWKKKGLGAQLVDQPHFPPKLFFVEVGFGVDQHGDDDATKAAIRAVRNAIEFNSIPGVIEHIPGGRAEMLIHVKLGVPTANSVDGTPFPVDVLQVAKVFPYGKLLPIQVVAGGLDFSTGRVVEELGDTHDRAVCVVACISIGYGGEGEGDGHTTYNTRDGH